MKPSLLITAAIAMLLVVAGTATLVSGTSMQPKPQRTGVSIGPSVKATCLDIAVGATQVATFPEWCRYATIQNLSANTLEVEASATSTSRSTCDGVLSPGSSISITAEIEKIAIKNIGAGLTDLNGADRTVIITGWR